MKTKSNSKNNKESKFKFSKHYDIGAPDAETDEILMEAFIDNDVIEAILKMQNQKSIIIGRTGSGKSAILKYIENTQERVYRIKPEAMSLRYLSNSTILSYFNSLNVNLTFFYKVLWKHVFIVELLKLYFGDNSLKKQTFFDTITDKIKFKLKKSNPKKEKALLYLQNWSKDFWASTEHRIKELEKNIQTKFIEETGIKVFDNFNVKLKNDNSEEQRILTEVKNKAERIINESQAEEIFEIISIIEEEFFVDSHKKHFIIIDDLDKDWIPSDVRYDLIGSMIEVIKEFQTLKGAKIIISLRDNLFQMIFSAHKHKGGQREKFKSLYLNLEWDEISLKKLLEKRLEIISENNLSLKIAFEKTYKDGKSGFDYMLERTFLRPRDVISFVNHAIENANNKSYFTLDIIKKAEIFYSIDRLHAIEDEWGENYGDLKNIFTFLHAKYNGFKIKNIKEDEFESVYFDENYLDNYRGDLLEAVRKWKTDEYKFTSFLKDIIYILYYIGIIGIKKSASYHTCFFYDKELILTKNDITNDCKIYVHKAFYSVFKINTKELE
jgi:hypothetical protein